VEKIQHRETDKKRGTKKCETIMREACWDEILDLELSNNMTGLFCLFKAKRLPEGSRIITIG